GSELVRLVDFAGVEQARLLDRDLAARMVEDRRAADLGGSKRRARDAEKRGGKRGAQATGGESIPVHWVLLVSIPGREHGEYTHPRSAHFANVPAYTKAKASGFTYLRSAALTSSTVSAAIAASIFAGVSNVRPRYA